MRWRALALGLATLLALPAFAHDTWFVREAGALQLVTGNRFPIADLRVPQVARSACNTGTCWAELPDYDIELDPSRIELYLREIHADAATRATWARWQADGLPWRERYRKFARIDWDVASASIEQRARARAPVGDGFELAVLGGERIAAGREVAFQLLRDGQPVADFPLELVSERQRFGAWRRTDAQGIVRVALPFGGQWLLRGTQLAPSKDEPGRWDSRFVTLVVEVR